MAGTVLQHVIPPIYGLVTAVREVIGMRADWARTAELVADQLRAHLPDPDILTPAQQQGHPDEAAGHVLHAEPDGTFSILGVVWRPGQSTRIHDHITWCVVGVLQGVEHEDLYDDELNLIGTRENHLGEVSGFAPPGDIHRIRNTGTRNRHQPAHLRHRHHPDRVQCPPLLQLTRKPPAEGEPPMIQRMDHVLIVVDDLAAAIAFFVELGMELEGEAAVEGEWVDKLIGLDGVRADIAVVRTPDGQGRVELSKFHTPKAISESKDAPTNTLGIRHIMFAVDNIEDVVARLRTHGAELVGELVQHEDGYRLCYVRGPEGIVISLSERLS